MKVAFFLVLVGMILVGILANRSFMKKLISIFSVYWFRFAFSFFVLFLLNVGLGFVGIFVPINIASAVVLTVLGFPGFVMVISLAIFL
ncbi:MAG TPA: pro-sigmaK processing inhibitor BofA family protein [Sporosarcina sp.]|nr:pro-sigmaK processing inhibitor BofA family protein [Sporosarcina sp.]